MPADVTPSPIQRHILPNRRWVETRKVDFNGSHTVHLSIGYDPEDVSRPREVFYAGGFVAGAALEFQLQDDCILISMLLQHGITPDEIAKSLAVKDDASRSEVAASIVGLIAAELKVPPGWMETLKDD